MKKKQLIFLAGLCTLCLTGCLDVAVFDYPTAQGTTVRLQPIGTKKKTIAVLPFMDQRSVKYLETATIHATVQPEGYQGSFLLGLIPLFPFGYVDKEEPEKNDDFVSLGRYHFDVPNDLAQAACISLMKSNLFAEVTKVNNIEQANTDYFWRGSVSNTNYFGIKYTYCITYILSPVLWVIGFPYGSSHNELWVNFELVERKSGNVLWTYHFKGSDYIVHWIYARIGKDTIRYPELMKQAMNGALYELNRRREFIK